MHPACSVTRVVFGMSLLSVKYVAIPFVHSALHVASIACANEMNLMFCSSCGTETSSMATHSGVQDRIPEPALLGGGLGTDGNETCAFKTACIKSPQKNFWDSNLT